MASSSAPASIADCFAEGIRLFNAQQFFEAHEAWETCWLRTEGRERMFYHGLIQAAAACVHLQHDRRKGAQLLYHKSYDKLQHFHGQVQGLAIGAFNEAFAAAFAPVLSEPAEMPIAGASVLATIPQLAWTPVNLPGATAQPPATGTSSFLKDESHGVTPGPKIKPNS